VASGAIHSDLKATGVLHCDLRRLRKLGGGGCVREDGDARVSFQRRGGEGVRLKKKAEAEGKEAEGTAAARVYVGREGEEEE
jgi:hypothetical protein